jgi:cobalamin synthase
MLDRVGRYATDVDFWIQAVLTAIVALILAGLARLSLSNAKWFYQYITISRKRRRQENSIAIWRRLKNDDYLIYSEREESHFLHSIVVLSVLALLIFLAALLEMQLLLIWLVIIFPLLFFSLTRSKNLIYLNNAARAYRAGLVRNKKTRTFEWPAKRRPRRP